MATNFSSALVGPIVVMCTEFERNVPNDVGAIKRTDRYTDRQTDTKPDFKGNLIGKNT